MKDLATRMKKYEAVFQYQLTSRTPVIIRLDGKAFHTLTRELDKPFDKRFMESMVSAASYTCSQIQGFKLAYMQSDEVNILLTDYDKLNTKGWFKYKLSKIVSLSAAMMSVYFTEFMRIHFNPTQLIGFFDSRAFNIPEDDIANYFLWRVKDWTRNSLNMFAQSFFSHKQLINKHSSDVHEMLHSIGKNWATNLPEVCKNGTWILKDGTTSTSNYSTYEDITKLIKLDKE